MFDWINQQAFDWLGFDRQAALMTSAFAVGAFVVWRMFSAMSKGAEHFVDRGIENERGQFESGQDFDERHVRLAAVHTRQDLSLMCYLTYWVVWTLVVLNVLVGAHVLHHW